MKLWAITSCMIPLLISFLVGLFCFRYSDSRILLVAYGGGDWTDTVCMLGLAFFWLPFGPLTSLLFAFVIYHGGLYLARQGRENSAV